MPKKSSILELFSSLGFIWGSYDADRDQIKFSIWAFIKSYAILFIVIFYPFKMLYCFKRISPDDKEMVLITGDIFFYFSPDTKAFLALAS